MLLFEGEITRASYWFRMLILFFAIFLLAKNGLIKIILLLFIPYFSIQIKRCNALGWSGWFSVLSLIPYIQLLWLLVIGLRKGRSEHNNIYSSEFEESQRLENSNFNANWNKQEKEQIHNVERVIECPSCKQKIRITLPLVGNVLKCGNCLIKIGISVDHNNHIYIERVETTNNYKDDFEIYNINDCFSILEISEDSSKKEIKVAYRKKMMEYHPDKVEKLGSKLKKISEIESRKLNLAYSMLKDHKYI